MSVKFNESGVKKEEKKPFNYNEISKKEEVSVVKTYGPEPEKVEAPKEEPKAIVVVLAHKLYVRSKADRKSVQIVTVTRGDKLEAFGYEKDWLRVKTKDGATGYVMKKFVEEVK